MTRVSFERYHDTYLFDCCGHTGYASAGRDILCSAVSVLCYTLAAYLEKAREMGTIANFISDFSDGNVHMRYDLADTFGIEKTEEAVSAILLGFTLLEENYPDHIETDF